jgi:hypothetical protein
MMCSQVTPDEYIFMVALLEASSTVLEEIENNTVTVTADDQTMSLVAGGP